MRANFFAFLLQDNGSGQGLLCLGITDSDLPFLQALGYLEFIEVSDSSITTLITDSFGSAYTKNYTFTNNPDLATVETDFLGSLMDVAETLTMSDLPSLT